MSKILDMKKEKISDFESKKSEFSGD